MYIYIYIYTPWYFAHNYLIAGRESWYIHEHEVDRVCCDYIVAVQVLVASGN